MSFESSIVVLGYEFYGKGYKQDYDIQKIKGQNCWCRVTGVQLIVDSLHSF